MELKLNIVNIIFNVMFVYFYMLLYFLKMLDGLIGRYLFILYNCMVNFVRKLKL